MFTLESVTYLRLQRPTAPKLMPHSVEPLHCVRRIASRIVLARSMSPDRRTKSACSTAVFAAFEMVHRRTQFDPRVVEAFLEISEERWRQVWREAPLFTAKP